LSDYSSFLGSYSHNGGVAWYFFTYLEEFQAMEEVALQQMGQLLVFLIYSYFYSFHIAKIIN
jgi:hypothetical protein